MTRMMNPPRQSAGVIVAKTVTAVVLICSAVVFLAVQMVFGSYELLQGRSVEKPESFAIGMAFVGLVLPFLVLGTIAFTFFISLRHGPTWPLGLVAAVSALTLIGILFVMPFIIRDFRFSMLLLPAFLLGKSTGSSVGWYLGSTIQLAVGAWLLGWLDSFAARRAQIAEPSAAPNGGPATPLGGSGVSEGPPSVS